MTAKRQVMTHHAPVHAGLSGGVPLCNLPRGYGSMRDVPLNLDPRIDLTKPIYEQVLALEKADKEAAGQG